MPELASTVEDLGLDYLDSLENRPVGQGRLTFGRAFDKASREHPPLLFVHGGYHGAWCYATWLRELDARGVPAATVDIRGHGGLPIEAGFIDAGVSDYADDVAGAIAEMPVPPILLGHSLGGLVVAVAAEGRDLAGLVLLAPSPPGQLPGAQKVPTVPTGAPVTPPAPAIAMDRYYPRWKAQDLSSVFARMSPESPTAMNQRYELMIPVDRARITAPALSIACGLDDHERHPDGQDEAVAAFYDADFITLPNASHCLMVDPDWWIGLDTVLDWCRAH